MNMYQEFLEKINLLSKKEIDLLWENLEEFENVGPKAEDYINCLGYYAFSGEIPPETGSSSKEWISNVNKALISEPFFI